MLQSIMRSYQAHGQLVLEIAIRGLVIYCEEGSAPV